MTSASRLVGFGCMRLSTDRDRDEERALATLGAALEAGATLLDTAPSYGLGEGDEHHNERLVARALASFEGDRSRVRIATKGGLVRKQSAWVADGRARSLRAACEASLKALGLPAIDLYFLHAPDPKTPLSTSVRALAALQQDGLVRAIGLSNVSLAQLEAARNEAEIEAIQIALGAFDDAPFRSGLVERALELGLTIVAHTPLGGPKRAAALARDAELAELGRKCGTSAAAVVLAWLYAQNSLIVPIAGARRPETARQAIQASALTLAPEDSARLDRRFPAAARALGRLPHAPAIVRPDAEITLVMGIQGAGKSDYVRRFVDAGYERLNRDERGGTLRGVVSELARRVSAGGSRFVLDNTYPTRASRSHVLDVARDHGIAARCLWLDTPLEQAQINVVKRLIERHGRLPAPEELRLLSKKDPNAFAPTVQFRFARELEPPLLEEGFSAVEVIQFERRPEPGHDRPGVVLAHDVVEAPGLVLPAGAPVLVFAWVPDDSREPAPSELLPPLELALCTHGGGPPSCWCRPPLPGLIVAWMLRERIDPARSVLVGAGPAHERLARALGFRYLTPTGSPSGRPSSPT